MVFDLDRFIASCVAARSETDAILAVKEVLDRALSEPEGVAEALPPTAAEFRLLYSSADLSVIKMVWGPGMSVPPHDHLMWAVNGIYSGEEDNRFYRRSPDGLVDSGGRRLRETESAMLGADVIHAVTNPRVRSCTGSIHVYGGDFMGKQRSIWDPDTHEERPADGETVRTMFERARAAAE